MSNLKQCENLLKVDSVQLSTYDLDESIFLNRNAYPVNEFYDSSALLKGYNEDKTDEDNDKEKKHERERNEKWKLEIVNDVENNIELEIETKTERERKRERGTENERESSVCNNNQMYRENEKETNEIEKGKMKKESSYFQIKNFKLYKDMYEESVKNPERFWGRLAKSSLRWFQLFTKVYSGDFIKGNVSWFINGKINACDNCVDRWVEKHPNKVALIWEGDNPTEIKKITYKKLLENVCRVANLLKFYGVKKQDTVTIYLPMIPELVYSMLACVRLGAIHNVVFAGYSAGSLSDRIMDSKSKILITSDYGLRGGKITKLKHIADQAMDMCKIITTCIVFKNRTKFFPVDLLQSSPESKHNQSMNTTTDSLTIHEQCQENSSNNTFSKYTNVSYIDSTKKNNSVFNSSSNISSNQFQEGCKGNVPNNIGNHVAAESFEEGEEQRKNEKIKANNNNNNEAGLDNVQNARNAYNAPHTNVDLMRNSSCNINSNIHNRTKQLQMPEPVELGSVPYVTSCNDISLINRCEADPKQTNEMDAQYEISDNFDERLCRLKKGRDVDGTSLMKNMRPYCPIEYVDSEDFLCLLYTSGSTGKPKGVAHTTAGYLLYAYATCKFIFDVRENDVFGCVADIGWVTGHTYVLYGPLLNGITTMLFSSVPTYPNCGRYWQMIQTHRVTQFYTAPTALRALMKYGDHWLDNYDLSSCRIMGTVGEPINPETWRWYYTVVGKKKCIIVDTYWQTETGGIVIAPIPGLFKLKPGCATLPFFGVEVEILDSKSLKPLTGPNVCGLLCIKSPWPGMLRTVYGNHNRLVKTYFETCPNYYFTGDGAYRDIDGYYWISGRIDDTLNVSGHRLGAAEIEHALVQHKALAEAAVVSVPHAVKGEGILCFVVRKKIYMNNVDQTEENRNENIANCNSSSSANQETATQECTQQKILEEGEKKQESEVALAHSDADLIKELKLCVRKFIGPIATPDLICIVPDLPKTRSGKIIRRILRAIANGIMDFGDITTVANYEIIDVIKEKFAKCKQLS